MQKIYPYKTPEQIQRCAEIQSKADRAAANIKYAYNKKKAVRSFLQYLYLSIWYALLPVQYFSVGIAYQSFNGWRRVRL